MIFLAPLTLLGLLSLPAVWWLIRSTPPSPRTQSFPPIAWIAALRPKRRDAVKAPIWLLILRLLICALIVFGCAQPVLTHREPTTGASGTTLLVLDDGWASAVGWRQKIGFLTAQLDQIDRASGTAALIRTAPDSNSHVPAALTGRDPASLRQMIETLRPQPWATNRAEAAARIATFPAVSRVIYVGDGLATPGDQAFTDALEHRRPVEDASVSRALTMVLTAHLGQDGHLTARIVTLPLDTPSVFHIRARNAQGGTLAAQDLTLAAGARAGEVTFALPTEVNNEIDRLTVDGAEGIGGLYLLDEGSRRRPVGLITGGAADTPLVGAAFYLKRALTPTADVREGDLPHLLQSPLSVLMAPDGALNDASQRARLDAWVRKGGTLVRFAGDDLAQFDDSVLANRKGDAPLLPVPLVNGTRQLGGAMSWGKPQPLAPFAPTSPFHDLKVPQDVTVSRQVLAQPSTTLDAHSWARLADGTPLVTHTALGAGQIVLFHVTSTPAWSSLPLSGLFVQMLDRLIQQASGIEAPPDGSLLAPTLTLDGDGVLGPPQPGATGLAARAFTHTPPSPAHPPGLYGPRQSRRALNLGDTLGALQSAPRFGVPVTIDTTQHDTPLAPYLLLAGLALLLVDALLSLGMRGYLHRFALTLAMLIAAGPAIGHAETVPPAALEARLAYIRSGHDDIDSVAREGLQGLSDYVNARTSAALGHPDAVTPGVDDLSYYPMLYWPVTSDAASSPERAAALNTYMAHGGILLIDTMGSDPASQNGSGDNFTPENPGVSAALRRVTAALNIPVLMRLDDHHVLSHTFYLLHDFPGRYAGQPVWVARAGDASNDGVSPVIIGSADWAHAWAVDADGNTPFAVVPGGDDQRRLAYRFGVNAVLYALTGNYKADQVHVPAILHRLGQ